MRNQHLRPLGINDGLRAQVLHADTLFKLNGHLLKAAAVRPVGNLTSKEVSDRTARRVEGVVKASGEVAAFAVLDNDMRDDGTVPVAKIVGADSEQGLVGEGIDGKLGTLPDQDAMVLFSEPLARHDETNPPFLP